MYVIIDNTVVMNIHVFTLSYNESALIPHMVHHYKTYMPSCTITVYDNESTDDSVEKAKALGCNVISWNSNGISDENIRITMRNSVWKGVEKGWIFMVDMDEFICVTERELCEEEKKGTTILKINGLNMIGDSNTLDLTDIDLQNITKYVPSSAESKNVCFLREKIKDMNYGCGSHTCKPSGIVKYSSTIYNNKHMEYVGLPYITNKMVQRYERSHLMRKKGWGTHYTNNITAITSRYNNHLANSRSLVLTPLREHTVL